MEQETSGKEDKEENDGGRSRSPVLRQIVKVFEQALEEQEEQYAAKPVPAYPIVPPRPPSGRSLFRPPMRPVERTHPPSRYLVPKEAAKA